jgi:hypothetical protein
MSKKFYFCIFFNSPNLPESFEYHMSKSQNFLIFDPRGPRGTPGTPKILKKFFLAFFRLPTHSRVVWVPYVEKSKFLKKFNFLTPGVPRGPQKFSQIIFLPFYDSPHLPESFEYHKSKLSKILKKFNFLTPGVLRKNFLWPRIKIWTPSIDSWVGES